MSDLTTRADILFEKANKLLAAFPFVKLASKHFDKVALVGSASMNLMMDADVDIDCEVSSLNDILPRPYGRGFPLFLEDDISGSIHLPAEGRRSSRNCYKSKVTDFVNGLLDYKEFRKVIVYNQLFDEEPYCIVNIERLKFEDENWIVTFYISANLHNTPKLTRQVKEKLDQEKRETILQFKEYRFKNKQKRSIPSHLIYEAVLDGGITTIDDFKTFLSKNGIDPNKQDEY